MGIYLPGGPDEGRWSVGTYTSTEGPARAEEEQAKGVEAGVSEKVTSERTHGGGCVEEDLSKQGGAGEGKAPGGSVPFTQRERPGKSMTSILDVLH